MTLDHLHLAYQSNHFFMFERCLIYCLIIDSFLSQITFLIAPSIFNFKVAMIIQSLIYHLEVDFPYCQGRIFMPNYPEVVCSLIYQLINIEVGVDFLSFKGFFILMKLTRSYTITILHVFTLSMIISMLLVI